MFAFVPFVRVLSHPVVERTLLQETCWKDVATSWKRHSNGETAQ